MQHIEPVSESENSIDMDDESSLMDEDSGLWVDIEDKIECKDSQILKTNLLNEIKNSKANFRRTFLENYYK